MNEHATENETMKAIIHRKSARAFDDRPIPDEIRQAILLSAAQAPTAGNQMLYTILDITDQALKETLSKLCDNQPFIAAGKMVLIFLADYHRWLDTYRAAGLSPRGPMLGDLLLACADAVIAAQNTVVAAESFGVGSCYIGDIMENAEQVRGLLSLPSEVMPAAMLVFGYPAAQQLNRRKPERFDLRYIVFENQYKTLPKEVHREMYMDRETRSGRPDTNFEKSVEAFWRRKYESDFAVEMSRSAGVYLKAFEQKGNDL